MAASSLERVSITVRTPDPSAAPALYSRRVTDRPWSMLIWVLNKHTGAGLLGRERCRNPADRQRETNFAKQAFLSNISLFCNLFPFSQHYAMGAGQKLGWGRKVSEQSYFAFYSFNLCLLTEKIERQKNRVQIFKENCAAKSHQISLVPDQTIKQGKVLHCRQLLSRQKPFDNLLSCGNSHLQEL